MSRITACLWFDTALQGGAEPAARFYTDLFPDSSLDAVHRSPADYPGGKKGDVLMVAFTLMGVACTGLNGGGQARHTEAFSFQIATETQEETDRYWDALTADGGAGIACSWCKDRWGLRWQIVPRTLSEGMSDPDPEVRARVFTAMQTMVKIDIAAIEAARRGDS